MFKIERRDKQIEEVAEGLEPEYQADFLQSAQELGWYQDYVVADSEGNETWVKDKGWARAIARGEAPTRSNRRRK